MQDHTSIAADLLLIVLTMLGQPQLDVPRTVAIEPQILQERVCGRKCKVFAWYSPEGTIYLDKRLNLKQNIFARGVLVHELMHHVQRMRTGHAAKNCREWEQRERTAYAVQSQWLRRQGVRTAGLMRQARLVRCSMPSSHG